MLVFGLYCECAGCYDDECAYILLMSVYRSDVVILPIIITVMIIIIIVIIIIIIVIIIIIIII